MTVKVKKRKVVPVDVAVLPPKAPKPTSNKNIPSNNTQSNNTSVKNTVSNLNNSADKDNQTAWLPPYSGSSSLDTDTINYIHRIYCRECQRMEEQSRNEKQPEINKNQQPTSPQTQVEEQSLQQTMDKNKESLKRKLMLRRSVNELVDQGIYPPLKTPPAFAEQRKQLERAKTGDLLRQKLKQRPDRLSLVQHHILEDTKPNVDPSLQEKQRLLKKARLQDSLTDRLANRPGPLELVQGNILQAEPELKDALQEGTLVFTKTADVDDPKRRHFQAMDTEDSNNTSDGAQSPQLGGETTDQSASPGPVIPTPPDITPLLQKLQQSGGGSPVTFTFAGNLPPITSQSFTVSPPIVSNCTTSTASMKNGSVIVTNKDRDKGLSRIKKKSPKPPSKSKVIKFHEYKGPPSVVKSSSQSFQPTIQSSTAAPTMVTATIAPSPNPETNTDDTPYHIMLQQQQLFLQWQLEFQQKNMPLILPASANGPVGNGERTSNSSTPLSTPTSTPGPPMRTGTPGPSLTMAPTPPPPSSSGPPIHTTLMPVSAVKVPAVLTNLSGEQQFKNFAVMPTSVWNSSGAISLTSPTISTALTPPQGQTVLQPIPLKITKLEDMKVADLKVELKKRNLPVSGPKPQLIERLKQYSESISSKQQQQQSCKSTCTAVSAASSGCMSSVSSISSVVSEVSLTSPSSINNLNGIINIQPVTPPHEDTMSMSMGSPPPMSPCNSLLDLNTSLPPALSEPDSPENFMDVQSPSCTTVVSHTGVKTNSQPLGLGQTISHVKIDPHLPRPPSAVPMEVDLSQSLKLSRSNSTTSISSAQMNSRGGNNSSFVDPKQHPMTAPLTPHASAGQAITTQVITSLPPTPAAVCSQSLSPAQLITLKNQTQNVIQPQLLPKTITIQPETPQLCATTFQAPSTPLQSPPHQQIMSNIEQPPKATTPISVSSSLQMAQQIQQIQANLQAVQASMQQAVQQAQLQQAKLIPQTTVSTNSQLSSLPNVQNSLLQSQTSTTNILPQQSLPALSTYNHGSPTGTAHEPRNSQGLMQIHVTVPSMTQQHQVVGQPQVIAPEELLRQQQKQIDDLRRQLLQSQQSLQEAQRKAIQHQEQLNVHLAHVQAQTQALASASQSTSVDTHTDCKVSQAPTQVLQQPVYAHIQIQPVTTPPSHPLPAPSLNQFTPASSSPTTMFKSEMKPNISALNHIIQTQNMQQSLLSQNNKVLFNVMQQPNGQQLIFTSQPNAKVTLANHILNNQNNKANLTASLSINGGTQNNKASSVPSSPVGHPKLQRTSTNPFFNSVPLREPPKYDEAIKNKQNLLLQQTGSEAEVDNHFDDKGPSSVKSQAMDDVLEILIRNGELPASAAQDPPPTPKTEASACVASSSSIVNVTSSDCVDNGSVPPGVSTILIPASSSQFIPISSMKLLSENTFIKPKGIPGLAFSSSALVISTNTVSSPVTTSAAQSASAVTRSHTGPASPSEKTSCTNLHKDIPTPLILDTSLSSSVQNDLPSAFSDGLPSSFSDLPFISMDWSDSDLPDNLLDTPNPEMVGSKLDNMDPDSDSLLTVYSHNAQDENAQDTQNGFVRGSEPNFAALGLNDVEFADAAHAMNIDVSDWLDVIMPSTGLTPMSTTAPTAFLSDPILTPKPQDVLDLFNMEESDLYTPTELGISFEKGMETSVSKS